MTATPATTTVALEFRAYFAARDLCLQADPPCAVRPCAKHHAEAYQNNGAVSCPACNGAGVTRCAFDLGYADEPQPCEMCDGYGRCWIVPVSALASDAASSAFGGSAATGALGWSGRACAVPRPAEPSGHSTLRR